MLAWPLSHIIARLFIMVMVCLMRYLFYLRNLEIVHNFFNYRKHLLNLKKVDLIMSDLYLVWF